MAGQLVAPTAMASNFLVPNATFLVELAAFAVMFFLLARYVIPPINKAMTARQDAIRTLVGLDDDRELLRHGLLHARRVQRHRRTIEL